MYWAIAIFVIKLIIISNVQGGAWPGADHEGYTNGPVNAATEGWNLL
jgi:ABC-type cobalt transport system substrate-binding protein